MFCVVADVLHEDLWLQFSVSAARVAQMKPKVVYSPNLMPASSEFELLLLFSMYGM